jgi:metallo-beta-lactamase family protein
MHGEFVPVKASIEQVQSFSVHADADELIKWLQSAEEKPGRVFVVHGEAGAADVFSERIHSQLLLDSKAPKLGERIVL